LGYYFVIGRGRVIGKLNEFHGDYIRAEMVKAFLDSIEYRKRFGQKPERSSRTEEPRQLHTLPGLFIFPV